MRFVSKLSVLMLGAGLAAGAQEKVNPHTQVNWPAACTAANTVYSFADDSCITIGGSGGGVTPSPQFSLFYQPSPGTAAAAVGDPNVTTDGSGHVVVKTLQAGGPPTGHGFHLKALATIPVDWTMDVTTSLKALQSVLAGAGITADSSGNLGAPGVITMPGTVTDSRVAAGQAVNTASQRQRVGNVCAEDYLWTDTVYAGTDIGYAFAQALTAVPTDASGLYTGTLSICNPGKYVTHTTIDWPVGLSGRGNGSTIYAGDDFKNFGVAFHYGSQHSATSPGVEADIANFKFYGHQSACHYSGGISTWCGYDPADNSVGVAQGTDVNAIWHKIVQGVDTGSPAGWVSATGSDVQFNHIVTAGFGQGIAMGDHTHNFQWMDWVGFDNSTAFNLNNCPISDGGELATFVGGQVWGSFKNDFLLNCKFYSVSATNLGLDYPNNAGLQGDTANASVVGSSPWFHCHECWFERNSGAAVNATVNVTGGSALAVVHESRFVEQAPAGATFAVTACDTTSVPNYVKLTGTWSSSIVYSGLLSSGAGTSISFPSSGTGSFSSNCTALNGQKLNAGTPGNPAADPLPAITSTTFTGGWTGSAANGADTGVATIPVESAYIVFNQPVFKSGAPDYIDLGGDYSQNVISAVYNITSVTQNSPIAGQATYCGSFSPVGANNGLTNPNWVNSLAGLVIAGFTNAADNGPAFPISSTNSCFTELNASAVTETIAATLTGAPTGSLGNQVKQFVNVDNDVNAAWHATGLMGTGGSLGPVLYTEWSVSNGLIGPMGGLGRYLLLNNYFLTGTSNLHPPATVVPAPAGPQNGLGYTVDANSSSSTHSMNIGFNTETSTITSVAANTPISGEATYTGTISNGSSDLTGYDFYSPATASGGFATAGNNGQWPIVSNTTTTIVVANATAVNETKTVTAKRMFPYINWCKGSKSTSCFQMQHLVSGLLDTGLAISGTGTKTLPTLFGSMAFPTCSSSFPVNRMIQTITDSPVATVGSKVTTGGGTFIVDVQCNTTLGGFYVVHSQYSYRTAQGFSLGTLGASLTSTSLGGIGGSYGAATSNFGTTAATGFILDRDTSISNVSLRCGATGVNTSSGDFKLYKAANGTNVESAAGTPAQIETKYGTTTAGTLVTDSVNSYAGTKGDMLILVGTTQALETLANCTWTLQMTP